MKLFGTCINWKVLVGVGIVAASLFVIVPKVAGAALPFLILAICPLSMLLMAGGVAMKGRGESSDGREASLAELKTRQRELATQIAALETGTSQPTRTPHV